MYSVILYSVFLLFWVAIIYDFAKRPKDRDDDKYMDLSPLRQLARTFWVGLDWYSFIIYTHCKFELDMGRREWIRQKL